MTSAARDNLPPPGEADRAEFERVLVEANERRLQWLLLGLITANGVMAFLGREFGPLAWLLPRTGQLMEFLVSPFLLGLLWLLRGRPPADRSVLIRAVVAVESLACAWYFYVALPVFGPTAVFALTIIAFGVFVLIPPRVFASLILPATIFHIVLAGASPAPLAVKVLVGLHGVVAAALALFAQHLLFGAKKAEFERDRALAHETEALRQNNLKLAVRCQDLQDSTALAAHDLKAPLQSLVAALRLASRRKEWRSELHASLLNEAIATCVGLLDLGGRLLNDYQDGHRGKEPGRHVRDLREIVSDAVASLSARAAERNIKVLSELPAEAAFSRVDPPTLRGAIENLLDNALSYSPCGSHVTLHLAPGDRAWRIDVCDAGPGIPSGEQGSLFSRFFQAGTRPPDAPPGNGLGLWIARQRVEAQGGELTLAESSPGGSVFRILLPACGSESRLL